MTFKQFMEEHNLSEDDVWGYTSKKHFYEGTKIPIFMVILDKAIADTNQDILVLSKAAAIAYNEEKVRIGELFVRYSEELKRYGLIMPIDTVPVDKYW